MKTPVIIALIVVIVLLLILILISQLKNIRESLSRMPALPVIILTLILVGALVFLVVRLTAPKGPDSLTSESVEGTSEGDAVSDPELPEARRGKGTGFTIAEALAGGQEGEGVVCITVCGDIVTVGETPFSDADELRAALTGIRKEMSSVCLVDHYAQASVLRDTESLLSELSVRYTIKRTD